MDRFLVVVVMLLAQLGWSQVQSPDEFLPHKVGEHFTPHHQLIDYFEHVAAESPLVKLVEYGQTNQGRPLVLAIVTSVANQAKLEAIRVNNLRMTGIEEGAADPAVAKAIVWLSHSVHGNEAAGSEASRQVLYELVDPKNAKTKQWLDNTVVIIDPSVNPDGYSRYTHWVRNVTSDEVNTDIQDIEHNEPWPGGRVNHYLFDLNRDWAWQTQVESQQRLIVYNQWLPHVHADLHEMGHESPYFFAPAAKPYHKYITQWQREFLVTVGKNHAKYFDEEGWLYFTKEVFDLFYPSYGDTYPTYSGAIGMTYEQGGSRRGGRGVELENGEVLTLKDRIDHHRTTALSTVEIASVNATEVISEFQKFYTTTSANPPGPYRTYVIKKDDSGERVKALAALLNKQGIKYGTVNASKTVSGFDYHLHKDGVTMDIMPGDLVVSALQPKAVMTQVLLDPSSQLEDSVTYDITAWSLPYAYGLHALSSKDVIKPEATLEWQERTPAKLEKAYAYIIPWTDLTSAKLVAALLKQEINLRTVPKEVQYEGRKYSAGAVVITRADNRKLGDALFLKVSDVVGSVGGTLYPLTTGFAEMGVDLGSGQINLIKQQKVLTVSGDGVGGNAFGQVKWYFDRVLDYPLSVVDIDRFGRVDLDEYATLILPDGYYSLGKNNLTRISEWVSDGGKLIVMSSATRLLVDQEGFSLKKYATDDEKSTDKKKNEQADLAARYNHYSEQERNAISDYVPGAIFKLQVDQSHPLGFGMGDMYYSLRTNDLAYPLMIGESNVMYHPKDGGDVIGFAGGKVRERLKDAIAFAVEDKGRGQVVYMIDNPLFRGFWYNGLFLFSNALFQVN